MKSLTQVIVLATLALITSCVSSNMRSIRSNTDLAVALKLNPDTKGNGVLAHCSNDVCVILTVAHLCHPVALAESVIQENMEGHLSDERTSEILGNYEELIKNNSFCNGKAIIKGLKEPANVTPILIDFDKDLMLMAVYAPGIKSNMGISALKKIKPGTSLYTVIIDPHFNRKLVLFSKAGIVNRATPDGSHEQDYLQTNFPVGPGASGSGVFLEESNLLMGLIGAQFTSGDIFSPIRSTYLIQTKKLQSVFNQYTEKKNDSKLDWPHCFGEKQLCKLVHGETTILEAFRHLYNEKDSPKK